MSKPNETAVSNGKNAGQSAPDSGIVSMGTLIACYNFIEYLPQTKIEKNVGTEDKPVMVQRMFDSKQWRILIENKKALAAAGVDTMSQLKDRLEESRNKIIRDSGELLKKHK